ncbi:MAG: ATP-binding protein, partial [Carboxydocellales bacterium]
ETYIVKTDDKKNKAQGGKRVMHTVHHPCWDAKNRDGLDPKLPFEYKAIAHCIPGVDQQKPAPEVAKLTDEPQKTAETKTVETPKQELPKQEPTKQETPGQVPQPPNLLEGVPKPLADLMAANYVTVEEIQQAVSSRGYYPQNTPIKNYDSNFISGVLVGAWEQVFQMIKDFRDEIPFK